MAKAVSWEKADVLDRLERSGSARPGLQVFLNKDVPEAEVPAVVEEIIRSAADTAAVSLGEVSPKANSFAVHGEVSALRRIADDPRVRAVTPTQYADILPPPHRGPTR
jgi:hypothetical protein